MGVEDEANAKDSRFVCFNARYFAVVVTGVLIQSALNGFVSPESVRRAGFKAAVSPSFHQV